MGRDARGRLGVPSSSSIMIRGIDRERFDETLGCRASVAAQLLEIGSEFGEQLMTAKSVCYSLILNYALLLVEGASEDDRAAWSKVAQWQRRAFGRAPSGRLPFSHCCGPRLEFHLARFS